MEYLFVELTHFYLAELFVDEFKAHVALFDGIEEILFGLEEGNQLLFIFGSLIGWQFGLDLCVQLSDIGIFFADESPDAVSGLLEFHLNNVHAFDLRLYLAFGQFLGVRLLFLVEADASHHLPI